LVTASLRVNFLRQFFAGTGDGAQSRYVGTPLRVGADGKVAIIARLTAYRC